MDLVLLRGGGKYIRSRAFNGCAAEYFLAYSSKKSQPAPATAYEASIVPFSSQLSPSWDY